MNCGNIINRIVKKRFEPSYGIQEIKFERDDVSNEYLYPLKVLGIHYYNPPHIVDIDILCEVVSVADGEVYNPPSMYLRMVKEDEDFNLLSQEYFMIMGNYYFWFVGNAGMIYKAEDKPQLYQNPALADYRQNGGYK